MRGACLCHGPPHPGRFWRVTHTRTITCHHRSESPSAGAEIPQVRAGSRSVGRRFRSAGTTRLSDQAGVAPQAGFCRGLPPFGQGGTLVRSSLGLPAGAGPCLASAEGGLLAAAARAARRRRQRPGGQARELALRARRPRRRRRRGGRALRGPRRAASAPGPRWRLGGDASGLTQRLGASPGGPRATGSLLLEAPPTAAPPGGTSLKLLW